MGSSGGGPPNKVVYVETKHMSPDSVANKLSIMWEQGYRGPYVSVGTVIYVAGYSAQ